MEVFDGKDFTQEHYDQGCRDIASQLVDENSFIDVIFGGGRKKFLRTSDPDPKSGKLGERIDGRNLIEEWQNKMKSEGRTYKYIWNLTEFENLKPGQYERVLGVLSRDHMDYELERLKDLDQPSISAMTQKAIDILSGNPNGYFLLVEGGKIDHGK
jgi:alkaline phosphatase